MTEDEELCQWDTETYRAWLEVVKRERMEGMEGRSGLKVGYFASSSAQLLWLRIGVERIDVLLWSD